MLHIKIPPSRPHRHRINNSVIPFGGMQQQLPILKHCETCKHVSSVEGHANTIHADQVVEILVTMTLALPRVALSVLSLTCVSRVTLSFRELAIICWVVSK